MGFIRFVLGAVFSVLLVGALFLFIDTTLQATPSDAGVQSTAQDVRSGIGVLGNHIPLVLVLVLAAGAIIVALAYRVVQ